MQEVSGLLGWGSQGCRMLNMVLLWGTGRAVVCSDLHCSVLAGTFVLSNLSHCFVFGHLSLCQSL